MDSKQADLKTQLKEIVGLLYKIERTYAPRRLDPIGELQDKIWNEPSLQTDELYFLQDLAGDLNFYEAVESDRDVTLGYYGDDKLLALTTAAVKEIESLLPSL
jgi:hypothetical protein